MRCNTTPCRTRHCPCGPACGPCEQPTRCCHFLCPAPTFCRTPGPVIITFPVQAQILTDNPVLITGTAEPGNLVQLCIDSVCQFTTAAGDGSFVLAWTPLATGGHTLSATQINACGRVSTPVTVPFFMSVSACPTPSAPGISAPGNGQTIGEAQPFVIGIAEPFNTVRVCIDGLCQSTMADENGLFSVQAASPLPDGPHTVTAQQINDCGGTSATVTSQFVIETGDNALAILSLSRGQTFRTVDAVIQVGNLTGDLTVHYLLLPPAAPAPSAAEVLAYSDPVTLSNGQAARGTFVIPLAQENTIFSRTFPGRETPPILPTETGVMDGISYILYMVGVTSSMESTGLIYSPNAAIGMPFASGNGIVGDPFIVQELTPADLLRYPDLVAGNPGNRAGVTETARLLDNIEGMQVLYDEDAQNGIPNSLALVYTLLGNFDLTGYAAAYGGNGWRPIGNYDATHFNPLAERHIFSGVLTAGGGVSQIINLPLTPKGSPTQWVEYVGLIGYAEDATVGGIAIDGVNLVPVPVLPAAPNFALRSAGLCGYMIGSTFNNVSVQSLNAFLTFGANAIDFSYIGGIIGQTAGGTLSGATAFSVAFFDESSTRSYCGGLIGNASINPPQTLLVAQCDAAGITDVTFSGTNQFFGGIIGRVYANGPVELTSLDASAVLANIGNMYGGGAFGLLYVLQPVTITGVRTSSTSLTSSSAGNDGGVAAATQVYSTLTLTNITVAASFVSAPSSVGGILGDLAVLGAASFILSDFTVDTHAIAANTYAGGAIGSVYCENAAFFYIHDGAILVGSDIECPANAGGLIGDLFHTVLSQFAYIENCIVAARIIGTPGTLPQPLYMGGLIGFTNYTAIRNCSFAGTITNPGRWTGGMVGEGVSLYLSGCSYEGTMFGFQDVGGLIGDIQNGSVLPTPPGLAPFAATPNLVEYANVRGLVSALSGGEHVGGLAGQSSGIVYSQCFSLADITIDGVPYLGGLLGRSFLRTPTVDGSILNCYATGDIVGTLTNCGGLLGSNVSQVENCYASGSVSASDITGGISAIHTSGSGQQITGCLALGATVASQSGPVAARIANISAGSVSQNYALNTMTLIKNGVPAVPVDDPDGPDGGTIAAAQILATITALGWDTATIWNTATIGTLGRPTLLQNPE